MINFWEIVFWIGVFIVFYTYVGYTLLLYVMVWVKELFKPRQQRDLPEQLPSVTLLIAAYNEQDIVEAKMQNCESLKYPEDKLKIVWVTDGSTDDTNRLLAAYERVEVLYEPQRGGKSAALNRATPFVNTPLVIYTDANTMLCEQAVMEIVRAFTDPRVGCVSGEKRVAIDTAHGATSGEGLYWKYESVVKSLDDRLGSAVGAAGELFAIRTSLYEYLPNDTLLDDFVLSIRIAQRGYKIAYCSDAYAVEAASADMEQEAKRKIRISAGGLQAVWRLRSMLNVFKYGMFSFQYISHKVLRWTIAPLMLFALLPLNIVLVLFGVHTAFYGTLLALQLGLYGLGIYGYVHSKDEKMNKFVYVPYYFLFMNVSVMSALSYLRKHRGSGVWEKAVRVHVE